MPELTYAEKLHAAIVPLLRNEDESKSLEVRPMTDKDCIEVFLKDSVVLVKPVQLQVTDSQNEWPILAQGCLDRLRNRHSLLPQRQYTLTQVYEESNQMLFRIIMKGLPDAARILEHVQKSNEGIKNEGARLKAINDSLVKTIIASLGAVQTSLSEKGKSK
jgi:hypothetical protein